VKQIKHQSAGKERIIQLKGLPFHYISPAELIHGLQEIFVDRIYEQPFGPQPYILDCGANVGLSVRYFKSIAPDAIIEAFEPDPANFALLEKNVAPCGNGIVLHRKAIWKENTVLRFESGGLMSSRIADGAEAGGKQMVDVEAVRLKDWLQRPVDFLKIDIEGAEYEVLRDVQDSLGAVKCMFIEYHGTYAQNGELVDMLRMVQQAGFHFYIKEATSVYDAPFNRQRRYPGDWDVQLNIFCIRK
jgi:FkbM family methyltransferase